MRGGGTGRRCAWRLLLLGGALGLLAGCGERADPVTVTSPAYLERVDAVAETEALHQHLNPPPTPRLVPEDVLYARVLELNPSDRELILDHYVERLKGPGWEAAQLDLIAFGKDSIPRLIAVLDRTDETAAWVKDPFAVDTPVTRQMYDFGELAYFTLLHILGEYSNWRGDQTLPPKDRQRWEAWWAENQAGLIIRGRGHSLVESPPQ